MPYRAVERGATGRSVEAFNSGIDALLVFYAPDVVCHPAPGWVDEEILHGHDGIRRLSSVWAETVAEPEVEIHDVRDRRERVLVLARLTGRDRDTGEHVEQEFALLNSQLRANGTVGEVRFFLSWQQALEEAGLPA